MSETWKPVPDYEGWYEVSDLGRVRSVDRVATNRPGVVIRCRGVLLRPRVNTTGYLEVTLQRNGTRRHVGIHRLVLAAFVGPCPEGMEGCHGDGDKENNAVSNLRWDTRSANTYDKIRHGKHPHASKTHCKNGHPFDELNTYHIPSGGRQCRACRNARKRSRSAA